MRDSGVRLAIRRVLLCWLAVLSAVLVYIVASSGPSSAQQVEQEGPDQPRAPIAIPGKPIPPDRGKLSEHNALWLKTRPAQEQMEFLPGAAINHDEGATDRIHEWLASRLHDKDQQTRFWAVEGLAHIGTDDTIKNFLDVLRNDPSMEVRERAGCSMAKSGMLTREQRMKAVPGLLELTDDPALNATTRLWVYQALREITDENLPNDPATWRNWYSSKGAERTREFKQADSWAVLGNK